LSEEIFTRVVKTKTFLAPNNLEGVTSDEQEIDLCVICQVWILVPCIIQRIIIHQMSYFIGIIYSF